MFLPQLYLASAGTVLEVVRRLPEEITSVMVTGHNPATHELSAWLAKSGNPDDIAQLRAKFPTGAVAVIDLRVLGKRPTTAVSWCPWFFPEDFDGTTPRRLVRCTTNGLLGSMRDDIPEAVPVFPLGNRRFGGQS